MSASSDDLAFGCVMGLKDWKEIVCRLVPELGECCVGKIEGVHVALDRTMAPTQSVWHYRREDFERHLGKLTNL